MNTKICPTCEAPIPANAPGGFCPACLLRGADEPAPAGRAAPSLAEVGAAFPQLEVQSLIGQGGMGFVYKVRQPSLDRVVALKLLSPELGRDPAFAERFAREARVLGKLNHPNIVTVFEHGESGGFFYLLMEYVDGVNLRQAMRAGRFTPPQALAVVPGICDALQAAHAQGVWHRDIKPENILLDARGGVKIADFGIARIVGDPDRDFTLTATGAALGSAAYMAPEQHEKPHDVDHRADIYSLGVVIYEMLTGELPLGRFPAPSQRAEVNARIDEIVFRTLEKERELRQQSAAEVKTDVQGAATAAETARANATPAGTSPLTRLPELVRWSLALLIAGGVLLVVAFNTATSVANHFGGTSAWSVIMHMNKLGDTEGLNLDGLMAFWPGTMVFVLGVLGCVWSFVGTERRRHQSIALEKERELRQQSATAVKADMQGAATAAEPARKNDAPDGASGLTRLPKLVRWSLGLFLGGGTLMGSAALVADSFKTQQTTAMMALLIALGGAASAAGFLGTLWSLYEILTGKLPLGRFPAPSRRATVSARTDDIVPRTLEKERELRQQSAAEVKTDVSRAAGHVDTEVPSNVFALPSPHRVSLMAAIGGAALLAFVAFYTAGSDRTTFLHVGFYPLGLGVAGMLIFKRFSQPGLQERRVARWWGFGILLVTGLVAAVAYLGQIRREQALRDSLSAVARPAAEAPLKAAATPDAVETWSFKPVHTTPEEMAAGLRVWLPTRWQFLADAVPAKTEAGNLVLTGSREWVRQLATTVRTSDLARREEPLKAQTIRSPEYFIWTTLPPLMWGDEFSTVSFESACLDLLKRQEVTENQLARALSNHVFELEKVIIKNTGTPFELIMKTKGASTTCEAVIPCADQPDKPLTVQIRRTVTGTEGEGMVNSVIAGFSPWLIEEAKQQSKGPLSIKPVK